MTKKTRIKREMKSGGTPLSLQKQSIVEQIIQWQWFPHVLFGFLSLLYFIRIFQGDLTFFASEGGVLAYKQYGWGTPFINPFEEGDLWYNLYLGGMPKAQALIPYTHYLIHNFLNTIVTENIAYGINYILLLFTAGIGMYFFLHRGMGFHRLTALVIGVAYMFAPANLSLTYAGHLSKMGVYSILPFQFWFTEQGMNTGRIKYFLYVGGLIALSIGTAHLQYAYLAMWGIALFVIFKFLQLLRRKVNWKSILLRGLYFAFAVFIGLGIAARAFVPQYLHTATVSKRSIASENQEAGKSFAASWSLHPEEIVSLVLPEFAGFDLGNKGQQYWGRNSFKINSEYFGVIILLFAIGGFLFSKKNGYIQFATLLFLFTLLYSLGVHSPLFSTGYHLIPGMKFVRGLSFLSLLFTFAAMFMAGFGIDQFINPEKRKYILWNKWMWIGVVFLGIGFFSAIVTGPLLTLWKSILYTGLEGQKAQAMAANQNEIKIGGLILLLLTGGLLGLFHALRTGKINSTVFGMIILLIVVFDSWRIDKQFLEWIPVNRVAPPSETKLPPYEFLKERDKSLYRILPFDSPFYPFTRFAYPNVNLATGFNDFTLLHYYTVMNQLTLPLVNLLCCKYFVTKEELNMPGFQQIYSQDKWNIYLNPAAYPYIYFAHQWQLETDKGRILNIVSSGSQDFSRKPIIDKDSPSGFVDSANFQNDSLTGTVNFLNQAAYYQGNLNENVFEVNQPASGLLVISENFHPDWHGYVDGKEVPVYQVNYLWRGVFVPSGKHRVELRFISRTIYFSRMISFVFILFYIALLGGLVILKKVKENKSLK